MKIRVFMIGMSEHEGGVESYIKNLCNQLDNKYEILYSAPEMYVDGKKWVRPKNRHNILQYLFFWTSFFLENKFDVLYFNTCDIISIDMLRFAKYANIPVRIIHSHCANDNWKLNFFQRFQEAISKHDVCKCATHLFACSKEAGCWMYGEKPFVVVKNGVKLNDYQYSNSIREQKRLELKIAASTVIGCVGRLEEVKNLQFSIDILGCIKRRKPNVKLVMVGEGSLRRKLYEYAYQKGLCSDVEFLGMRNDVNELMSIFDCLLMPSLFEGLPFVLIEAQMNGLHCVVSSAVSDEANISGLVDYISLEETSEYWADKVLVACEQPRKDVKDKLIDAGYSIEDTAKQVSEIIEKALNEGRDKWEI